MKDSPVDIYILRQKKEFQEALEEIRAIIREILPDATEEIGWGMPGFKMNGKWIIGFAGFQHHMSIFPHSGSILEKMENEIKNFSHTKSALHFTPEKPLTRNLVEKMIALRLMEAREKAHEK